MDPMLVLAGATFAVVLFLVIWLVPSAFPYLTVTFLGLEYFSPAAGAGIFTIPKIGFAWLALVQVCLGRCRYRFSDRGILPALAMLALFLGVSYLWSVNPARAQLRATSLVALVVTFIVIVGSIRSAEGVHQFLRAFVLYGAASAIAVGVQIFFGIRVYEDELGVRAGGLGVNPSEGAFYLGIAMVITIGYHLHARYATKWMRHWAIRVAIIGILGAGLLSTASRGGVLAFLLALGILIILSRPTAEGRGRMRARLGFVFAIVTVVLFLMSDTTRLLTERLTSSSSDQMGNRVIIWEQVAKAVAERPILGSGLSSAAIGTSRYEDTFTYSTHNSFLTALLDGGVVGLVLFVIVGWRVIRTISFVRGQPIAEHKFLGLQLTGVLVVAVGIMMSYNILLNKLFWVFLAICEAMGQLTRRVNGRMLVRTSPEVRPMQGVMRMR